jgi:DNA-binding transcriptional LysR family regulator
VIALSQSRLQMQDLGEPPLVFMPVEYCPRNIVEAEYAKAQIKTQVVLEMTSHERILQAVAEGAGLTILPELYVRLRLPDQGCGLSACAILFRAIRWGWPTGVIDTTILPRGNSVPFVERPCPASSPIQSTLTAAL